MLDKFKIIWLINLFETAKKVSTKILLVFIHGFHQQLWEKYAGIY